MAIKKSLRFEVFKRDAFLCQYCGHGVPDAVLEVDHIHPVSRGGNDVIDNLITSCFECNRGKGAKQLTEKTSRKDFEKKIANAGEASEQLTEYRKYLSKLRRAEDKDLDVIAGYWSDIWDNENSLSQTGKASIRGFLKKHPREEILGAIDIGRDRVGDPARGFKYMCGVLHNKRKAREGDKR